MDDRASPENRMSEESGTRVRIPSSVLLYSRIAQQVAQKIVNLLVGGSNPSAGANRGIR